MSILSDKEIKSLCIAPTHYIVENKGTEQETLNMILITNDEEIQNLKASIDEYNTKNYGAKDLDSLALVYTMEITPELKEKFLNTIATLHEVTPEMLADFKPVISPFVENSVKTFPDGRKIPSYGLGSYSYDIRIDRNFKMFRRTHPDVFSATTTIIDTASDNPTEGLMGEFNNVDYIDIPPGCFVLGNSVEQLDVPRDCIAVCMAKSSLARIGLSAYVTPLEPEWKGYITIEINNLTPHVIRLWSGIGIMALMFNKADVPCEVSYADRNGKYQNQAALPIETVN